MMIVLERSPQVLSEAIPASLAPCEGIVQFCLTFLWIKKCQCISMIILTRSSERGFLIQ